MTYKIIEGMELETMTQKEYHSVKDLKKDPTAVMKKIEDFFKVSEIYRNRFNIYLNITNYDLFEKRKQLIGYFHP